jgi:hypothetical protein
MGAMPKLITTADQALLRWYGFGKDGHRVPTYVACTIDLWLQWWIDRYWSRKGARR